MELLRTEQLAGLKRNRALKDHTGQTFGRLTAMELVERRLDRNHVWRFQCSCGRTHLAGIRAVQSGNTSSCGCIHKEQLADRNSTHGLSKRHPSEYRIWKNMRGRCNSPTNNSYADYGGRGIKVDGRWDDFGAFMQDMGERPDGCSLDRVDVNGDYGPHNCRWATDKEQANNKRSSRVLEINGETRTLQQWCDHFKVGRKTVVYRLSQGWTVEQAFSSEDFRKPK